MPPTYIYEGVPQDGLGFGQGPLLEPGWKASRLIDANRDRGPKDLGRRQRGWRRPSGRAREDESQAISHRVLT